MVAHSERALDQGRDTLEGPALGGKARRHGAPSYGGNWVMTV
jgi:hypothetical protein